MREIHQKVQELRSSSEQDERNSKVKDEWMLQDISSTRRFKLEQVDRDSRENLKKLCYLWCWLVLKVASLLENGFERPKKIVCGGGGTYARRGPYNAL